jgi:hypothetical protein
MGRFIGFFVVMFVCLSRLCAQDGQDAGIQPDGSADTGKRDSIVLRRIDSENMFRKKILEIDSSSFDRKTVKKQLKASRSDYRQWRFGVNGGLEMIIAPEPAGISEELLKYRKKLKSGPQFGADAMFFISPNIGVGVNYSTFGAANKTNYISYEVSGNTFEGNREDNIRIHFVGPTISIRSIPKNNRFYASCDFSLGYFAYLNSLTLNNTGYDLKKENFGFATSIGADFMFTKNLSMGLSLNITAASIKKTGVLNDNNVENLSRISLVLTLKTYR